MDLMRVKKRNKVEITYQRKEPNTPDNRKAEQQTYLEYVWVSYSDEVNRKREDDNDNSILERSNRFAL